jgi:hypothetical protein
MARPAGGDEKKFRRRFALPGDDRVGFEALRRGRAEYRLHALRAESEEES